MLAFAALSSAIAAVQVAPAPLVGGWQVAGPANGAFSFRVAVKGTGLAEIKRIALAVSTPGSPEYTKFRTQAEIDRITAPTTADLLTVTSWIAESGCTHAAGNTNLITVTCPTVAAAGAMLSTTISTLANSATAQSLARAAEPYALPDEVAAAVDAVFGVHGLPLPPSADMVIESSTPAAKVTPDVIASTYSIPEVTIKGTANSQAVAEFQGEYFSPLHLKAFFRKFVNTSTAPAGSNAVRNINGPNTPGHVGLEAELDIQYIMGVVPGVATDFYSQKGADFCQDLVAWTALLLEDDSTPFLHSVSYGWQGNPRTIGCTVAEITTIDASFVKLAAKGISILFASGDSGSGYTNTGSLLYPSWPASSPWVTAVGATRFQGQKVGNAEQASEEFGSGGGFSEIFNRTDATWQEELVSAYIKSEAGGDSRFPPAANFPAGGRATPDVAALGEGYQVMQGIHRPTMVGGTSASVPAFSGLVSLLNQQRLDAGKKQLGFLNPFLYANADAFTDITTGTNAIDREGDKVRWGYAATKGWDAATGLGTPVYPALLKAALLA